MKEKGINATTLSIYWYSIVSKGQAVSKEGLLLVFVIIYCDDGNKTFTIFVLFCICSNQVLMSSQITIPNGPYCIFYCFLNFYSHRSLMNIFFLCLLQEKRAICLSNHFSQYFQNQLLILFCGKNDFA